MNKKKKIEEHIYNVCLMGASLDTDNMGVSALAASLIKIIKEIRPNADIALFIGNRSSKHIELKVSESYKIKIKVVNWRLSPKANIQEHLIWIFLIACFQRIMPFKSIKKFIIHSNQFLEKMFYADFIGEIHGGDSFSDIYGLKRFIIRSVPDMIALLLKKKLILLPQTYGPYYSIIGKNIAQLILNRSAHILSRDKEGVNIVRRLTNKQYPKKEVTFCPDVAFILNSIEPDLIDIQPQIETNINYPIIGFNVNGLLYNGGFSRDNMFKLTLDYKSFTRKLAIKLLVETKAHILFVPHTFGPSIESDPDACRNVLNSLADLYKKRIHFVKRRYNQSEIKGIINNCDFFIGSRMHACIAALSQGIPTVGIAYSRKFIGVFESVNLKDQVIDARKVDNEIAIESVLKYFHDRKNIKQDLENNLQSIEKQIKKVFSELITGENCFPLNN